MYSITPLHNSSLTTQGPVIFYQQKVREEVSIKGWVFLLEGFGRQVLVDCGIGTPATTERRKHAFTIAPGHDTLSLLQARGISPAQIDAVILTHLHWDHVTNAPLFEQARFFVSKTGWREIVQSPRHPALVPERAFPHAVYDWLAQSGRLELLEDEAAPLPGIRTFWIGGHTPCCQAVAVETARGTAVITSDTVSTLEHLEQNIAPASLWSLPECFAAYDRIRREADIVIPTHEPNLAERY
jgi:glyoxylase-like metal-dependent hydrolase (beta-lactamase superfamily II)